jgi:probable rRNA maturation factor
MDLQVSSRQKLRKINKGLVRKIIQTLKDHLRCRVEDVSVVFVDDAFITGLNRTYFSKDNPTDVISFPFVDYAQQSTVSGEIIISVERAIAQCPRYRTTVAVEVCRYVVHGFLHLLGYADVPESARARMKRKENQLLRILRDEDFPVEQLIS